MIGSGTSVSWARFWWRVAKDFRALVDQLLSRSDFFIRGSQVAPPLGDHKLRFLELGQGIASSVIVLIHARIISNCWQRNGATKKATADGAGIWVALASEDAS